MVRHLAITAAAPYHHHLEIVIDLDAYLIRDIGIDEVPNPRQALEIRMYPKLLLWNAGFQVVIRFGISHEYQSCREHLQKPRHLGRSLVAWHRYLQVDHIALTWSA